MSRGREFTLFGVLLSLAFCARAEVFEAKWESLDKRPVPQWWRDAKFGIFVHWGPYSVPAYSPMKGDDDFACYAEWYQGQLLITNAAVTAYHAARYGAAPYGNFAAEFKAENFNPDAWAALFKKAGAKYAVLTSKHHDGYALWPSAVTPYYNSVAIGSGRDLAGEFTTAMKKAGLRSGFYYSLLEYANPLYPKKRNGMNCAATLPMTDWARRVNLPQMKELVENYKADIIWPDGEWDWPAEDQCSEEFLAWLYNESSVRDTIVVNDRWGAKCRGHHGGHYTTEYGNADEGVAQKGEYVHPWEECRGIGKSFGYNRYETTADYMSREKCIETLVGVVSRGGNLLLNVGPTADGRIPAIMEDRLLAIGRWLDVNGEAIFGTTRWAGADPTLKKQGIYFTKKGDVIYLIFTKWPKERIVVLSTGKKVRDVRPLGFAAQVDWRQEDDVLSISVPPVDPTGLPTGAWTLRIE